MTDASPMPARPVNAAAQAKAQQAWTLRVAGMPWGRIAQTVGYSDDAGAIRAVRNYAGSLPQVDREASRALWRERLERLWTRAEEDVTARRPGAVRSAVAVAQRASLLDALDTTVVSLVVSPSASEFERVVRTLVAARGIAQAQEADIFVEADDVIDVETDDEG